MNRREKLRLLQAAEGYFRSGNHALARMTLDSLVAADASSSRAFELLGYIHASAGDLAEANRCLDKACRLPGVAPEAFYYLGASYLKLGDAQSAIEAFDRSMALAGPFFEALHDRGTAWSMLGRSAAALESYTKALQLRPRSFDLLFNIGKVHDQRRDLAQAIAFYDRALDLDPGVADVWAHKGAALYDAERYGEAIEHWQRALAIDPRIEFLPGFVLHARLRLCDWRGWEADRATLLERVRQGDNACGPFEMLALSSDESLQLRSAEHWVAALPPLRLPAARFERAARDKLRIAYFSADFGRHPVSYLTAELFERHDRDAFEVHAFALKGAAADDEMRARLVRAFDHFVEVEQLGDLEIVERARQLGIDIAIDLGGHTKGSRTALFKERVAPVQVNYLGYPGTMGADFVDYLVADDTIVPESAWPGYSERVVHLPDCFQPCDTSRPIPDSPPDRVAHGLPGQGFVFCSFNNTYKFNPEVFGLW
ncbi:MAG TPA: tetratricopeptide repeat protein, partial [Burkholderiaceae bacterium]|nr:tetratricopeptide repeat protein [Burkholderiaceae bacterium]